MSEDATPEKEQTMSAEKPARRTAKKSNGVAKATKKAKAAKAPKIVAKKFEGFPSVSDLRLESDGIATNGKSRYIEFRFTNGFVARLQDATANRTDAMKMRDLMSEWFTKRIGA